MRSLCCAILMSLPITLRAQADSLRRNAQVDSLYSVFRREGLRGLGGMLVIVGSADTSLRAMIEQRLRLKGIPFVRRFADALHQRGSPNLYVTAYEVPRKGSNLYHVAVELREQVSLVRNKAQTVNAVTWSTERFVLVDRNRNRIRDAALAAVDEFVSDYLAANPRH